MRRSGAGRPSSRAHGPVEEGVAARLGRPGLLVEPAEHHDVGVQQARFEQAPRSAAAGGWPPARRVTRAGHQPGEEGRVIREAARESLVCASADSSNKAASTSPSRRRRQAAASSPGPGSSPRRHGARAGRRARRDRGGPAVRPRRKPAKASLQRRDQRSRRVPVLVDRAAARPAALADRVAPPRRASARRGAAPPRPGAQRRARAARRSPARRARAARSRAAGRGGTSGWASSASSVAARSRRPRPRPPAAPARPAAVSAERQAGRIVDVDAPAPQFGADALGQRPVRRDQRGGASGLLQRLAQRHRDGQRLLALVGRLDHGRGRRSAECSDVVVEPVAARAQASVVSAGRRASERRRSRAASAGAARPELLHRRPAPTPRSCQQAGSMACGWPGCTGPAGPSLR